MAWYLFLQCLNEFYGFCLIWQIGKECLACRERVAVFNMSYFAKFYLTGPDAQKAADWIFTNNMAKPPGTRQIPPAFTVLFSFECNLHQNVLF